jgi:F-type H+-transporting ATPase subunit b
MVMFFANIANIFCMNTIVGQASVKLASESESTGLFAPEQVAGFAVTGIMVIINLLVAYLILRRFVFNPIIKLLNKRRETVMKEFEDAAKKTADAQTILAEANRRIEDSKNEASTIVSEARIQAEKQAVTIVNVAHAEATTIVNRATDDAKRMHNAMLDQMRDEVADLAIAIATKVVGSIIDDTHQKDISERIMSETLKAEVKQID